MDQCTDLTSDHQLGWLRGGGLFVLFAVALIVVHAPLLHLPYFWDEAGYYIPAARDLLGGWLIPHSTPSNAHPPVVMAWLALSWNFLGQSLVVTRLAMLLLATFSLLGFFRLARAVSNSTVAAASTFLLAVYPVFFAQSSLAQVDLPAAGLTFWGMESYVRGRGRSGSAAAWFSLAALAKETAILVPAALLLWELILFVLLRGYKPFQPPKPRSHTKETASIYLALLVPVIPLAVWYAYHYARTGFVFGNPEFFRYNLQGTLHPLRIFLALLLRIWQLVGYLGLYVLTLGCLLAMKYPALPQAGEAFASERQSRTDSCERPRIAVPTQLAFLTVTVVYLLAMSVLGGAVLARYMLPIVPLVILICVSTIWRRLKPWPAVLAIAAVAFVTAIFVNPPYGFSPEDNLAYRDYIRLHQNAESFIESRYSRARVLTAWPASDELSHPYLGYIAHPIAVVRIEDFTPEQLATAANARSQFDLALVFSTKYQPRSSVFDRWTLWQKWKSQYFGYHLDLGPEQAATLLGGNLAYVERRKGQWVGVIEVEKIEEAQIPSPPSRPSR